MKELLKCCYELVSDKEKKFTILNGGNEEAKESTERFLGALTKEEKEESMSEKFDYLDE